MENIESKVYYSLPDFYNNYQLNFRLLELMNKRPDLFRPEVVVDSVYGTFPGIIWNGGRVQFGTATYENMIATVEELTKAGISIRFTFTNAKLTGRHFKDYYGNLSLEILNSYSKMNLNGKTITHAVNVNNPAFAEYIEGNYPKLDILWSTTKGLTTADEVNELSKNHLTVVPYQMNNTKIIDDFIHPENIEFLCCESCIDNCPNRQAHYEDISKHQLLESSIGFKCPHGCEQYYYYDNIPKRKHYISPEKIITHYLPRGLNKFKISGRNDNVINVIERYVVFLAKPEYKDEVRNHLLLDQFC